MKLFIFLLSTLFGLVLSAPQQPNGSTTEPIPILRKEQEINHDGSYEWAYETANEIVAQEKGYVKNSGISEQEAQVDQGGFSYTARDGSVIRLEYTADKNGFQPREDHLPTPPPIPPKIQRVFKHLASLPQTTENSIRRY